MARSTQSDVFLSGEADNWFRRNAAQLTLDSTKTDWVCHLVAEARLTPKRVLEIGAANGYRLERLRRAYTCEAHGVEPSKEAVAAGTRDFPGIRMRHGVARDLSGFSDGYFDLVIINFVLHWIDRAYLFRAAAEADRVLADGGHIAIGDFAPARPQRVRYHHRPDCEVYTYKQNYVDFWLASGLYKLTNDVILDHETNVPAPGAPSEHRARVAVLQKTGPAGYLESNAFPSPSIEVSKPKGPHFLDGARIYLREVRVADANESYYRWMNDPEVTQYLEVRFSPWSRNRIASFVSKKDGKSNEILLAICLRDGDRHIGNIKIGPINWIHGYADVSLVIGEKDCWGQGFATEAIRLVCHLAFGTLNLRKLIAGAYHGNVGSIRAFERVGFVREGLIRGRFMSNGAPIDQVLLGMLAQDFKVAD